MDEQKPFDVRLPVWMIYNPEIAKTCVRAAEVFPVARMKGNVPYIPILTSDSDVSEFLGRWQWWECSTIRITSVLTLRLILKDLQHADVDVVVFDPNLPESRIASIDAFLQKVAASSPQGPVL